MLASLTTHRYFRRLLLSAALLAGVGYNGSGDAEAGMGVEIGDVDGDGRPDVFVTHLDYETNTSHVIEVTSTSTDGSTSVN